LTDRQTESHTDTSTDNKGRLKLSSRASQKNLKPLSSNRYHVYFNPELLPPVVLKQDPRSHVFCSSLKLWIQRPFATVVAVNRKACDLRERCC